MVTLEVIRNVLPAIANEMSHVLQRTSYNMMIYEVRDYCCGLLDLGGRLLAQNTGGVSHFVADLGVVIRDGVARYGARRLHAGRRGDHNHQRVGRPAPEQHRGLLALLRRRRAGRVRRDARPLDRRRRPQHRLQRRECARSVDGRAAARSDQIYGTAGRLDDTAWRIIRDNIRYPESSMGDLSSQIAACRLAERRRGGDRPALRQEVVERAIDVVFDQAEAPVPRGRCGASGWRLRSRSLFGGHALDGHEPVLIKVKVTVAGSDMTIDLTQCSPERRQPINARTLAAPLIAYKAITMPRDPVNEGAFRALEGRDPGRQLHDGAFPGADGVVGPDAAERRGHDPERARADPARPDSGGAPRRARAALSCSSASTLQPDDGS